MVLLSACSFTTIKTPEVVLTQIVVIPRNEEATQTPERFTSTPETILTSATSMAVESLGTSASPTWSPTTAPVNLAELRLMFWDVSVLFDTNLWQIGGHDHMPSITHRQISNCMLYEQGPTEHPEIDRTVTLGSVEYQVAELVLSGEHVDWYLGVPRPIPPRMSKHFL